MLPKEPIPSDIRRVGPWVDRMIWRARQIGQEQGRRAKIEALIEARDEVNEALQERGRIPTLVKARSRFERTWALEAAALERERIREAEAQLELGIDA